MQIQFGLIATEQAGGRAGEDPAGSGAGPTRPAAADLLSSPKRLGGAADAREPPPRTHTISLTSAYGELVASEEVAHGEFGAALRRFHERALTRANAVVVIDGITHTRNAFLEFVREFNDCAARRAGARG